VEVLSNVRCRAFFTYSVTREEYLTWEERKRQKRSNKCVLLLAGVRQGGGRLLSHCCLREGGRDCVQYSRHEKREKGTDFHTEGGGGDVPFFPENRTPREKGKKKRYVQIFNPWVNGSLRGGNLSFFREGEGKSGFRRRGGVCPHRLKEKSAVSIGKRGNLRKGKHSYFRGKRILSISIRGDKVKG